MKKRKYVPEKTCFLCQKSNLVCDGGRPCASCVQMGAGHICFGAELNSQNTSGKIPGATPTTITDTAAAAAMASTPGYGGGSVPFRSQNPLVQLIEDTPETPASQQTHRTPPIHRPAPATADIPEKQKNINVYFMHELRKLQADHNRLNQEVSKLRLQNLDLKGKLQTSQWETMQLMKYFKEMQKSQTHTLARPYYPALSNGTSSDEVVSGTGSIYPAHTPSDNPMVVYDLTGDRLTAGVVLTASDTFCKLLGYKLEDIIGLPWTAFIPPDAVERTINILSRSASRKIQFEQIYKHKQGGYFKTLDTHTIFFGADGKPTSDVVNVTLPKSTETAFAASSPSPAASPSATYSLPTDGTSSRSPSSPFPTRRSSSPVTIPAPRPTAHVPFQKEHRAADPQADLHGTDTVFSDPHEQQWSTAPDAFEESNNPPLYQAEEMSKEEPLFENVWTGYDSGPDTLTMDHMRIGSPTIPYIDDESLLSMFDSENSGSL